MCGCTIHVYKRKWTKNMVDSLKYNTEDMSRWVEDRMLVLAAKTPPHEETIVHDVRELLESYREAIIDQFLLTIIEEWPDDIVWNEDLDEQE